jgi:hypothetical protein
MYGDILALHGPKTDEKHRLAASLKKNYKDAAGPFEIKQILQ